MLSPELQQQINNIHLRTRRLVDGSFAGDYLSVFKGRGTEFAEVREYEPGDDVRSIDWKVTARFGKAFVKQYIEERELCVMLLADVSASTLFSSSGKSKRTLIAEICAAISMNALRHNNKVGLMTFSDRVEAFVAPGKGRLRTYRIIENVLTERPTGAMTDIRLALENMHRLVPQRTMCFVISDFLAHGYEQALTLIHKRHDLIPVCLGDKFDRSLPSFGLIQLQDLESGEMVLVDSSDPQFRQQHKLNNAGSIEKRNHAFRRLSINTIDIDTAEPFVIPLKRYFRQRELGRDRK